MCAKNPTNNYPTEISSDYKTKFYPPTFFIYFFNSFFPSHFLFIFLNMGRTEKTVEKLVEEYEKSGSDYAIDNPRALKIHVKRDLSEHRNVV